VIVRELVTRLGFNLNQGQLRNAEAATDRLRTGAEMAGRAFAGIFAGLAAGAGLQQIIRISDEMQSIRTRIGMLPQTVGDAGAAFDAVAQHASAAGASIDAYAGLYSKVGNAAKDYIKTQRDLLGITDTISQALVVGGATAQESAAVMIQFAQALGSGVLQGDEFRSMAEAAPQYLDKLSEAMGIPREQLKKMASEGKLTTRAVLDATRKMSGYFADQFKKMPLTVGRASQQIGNEFAQMLDKINRGTQWIPRLAQMMLDVFHTVGNAARWVVDKLGGVNNAARIVGITLGIVGGIVLGSLIPALAALAVAVWAAVTPWLPLAAGIALAAVVIEDLYLWISGKGKSLTEDLIGPWAEWKIYIVAAIDMVTDAVKALGDYLGATMARIKGIFTGNRALIAEGAAGQMEFLRKIQTVVMHEGTPFAATRDAMQRFVDAAEGKRGGVTNNTTVNMTVPPGTPQEQVNFLQGYAAKAFEAAADKSLARDAMVYAP
jgi:tape measure domain-containing protein